jgi:hypothetical protein
MMPGKNAFIDSVTQVLKAYGFVQANTPGDVVVPVPDDFSLAPGFWKWNGSMWQPFIPPPPLPTAVQQALSVAITAVLSDPTATPTVKALVTALKAFSGV